jgi:Flp pilus assembly protein TadD
VSYLTPQDLPSDSLQSAQPGLLSTPPDSSPELEDVWSMHKGADSPVLEATAEAVAVAEMPAIATAETTAVLPSTPVDAAAAQAAGDDLILLQARTVSVPEEDQQLAREPVLVENAYQIKAAPLDTSHVYSIEQDVVFHDFGDELQVSEVYVDFDELVDPADQTVRFDPEMLTEGEPELMPARALPIDDAGDVAVAGVTIAGFEALGEGRWEDAANHFREVCNARPGDAAALNDFGLALLQHAIIVHEAHPTSTPAEEPHFEAAVLALRQAAQQDKHDATIIYNLGTCLATCGRHGVASRIWDAAMTLAPSDAAPINGKAVSLIALGEFDAAASLLMRARDASPAEPVILRNLRRLRPTA